MLENSNFSSKKSSRILMLSQRELYDHVEYCSKYEFEDNIRDFDAVDMVAPANSYDLSQKIYKLVKRVTNSSQFANSIKPDPNPFYLDKEYELFFAVCQSPWEAISLNSIKGWRKKCHKAVCYIEELWNKDIQGWKPLLELLKDFDHIFMGLSHGTEAVADIIQRPCTYLPSGVDAIKFCPYPLFPHRNIDVCNIGRRSPVTHKALLELAEQRQIFYYYDTPKHFNVLDMKEHRSLIANLTKRSRYFIANKSKVNQVDQTGGQLEFGDRFFVGAAAGAVMIGDYAATEAFHKYFDWPDAAIQIPFDAANIADIIADLDAQPERLARISRDNVVNSLLRHDWVYRWREVLETVGLKPTSEMLYREAHLKNLAEIASAEVAQGFSRVIPSLG